LEFDTVFVIGATDSLFPNYRSQKENRLNEEIRLFYVAVTRAKKRLYVTYHNCNSKGYWQQPSRFLHVITKSLFLE